MADEATANAEQTKTEGAIKAGNGRYFFDPGETGGIDANPDYTTAHGTVLEGERTLVGVMHMPAETDAGMHTHPNEQFLYVQRGTLDFVIGDAEATVSAGELAYVPPGAPHRSDVVGDEDVIFFTAKDRRSGIGGTPVEDAEDGPADAGTATAGETTTEGAIRAGNGRYFFDPDDLGGIDAGPGYSSAHGAVLEGERIQIGFIRSAAGTGADPHTHPNEQFSYWLEGETHTVVDGEDAVMTPGTLRYVPPNVEHEAHTTDDGDAHFITVKDLGHGIAGTPVEDRGE